MRPSRRFSHFSRKHSSGRRAQCRGLLQPGGRGVSLCRVVRVWVAAPGQGHGGRNSRRIGPPLLRRRLGAGPDGGLLPERAFAGRAPSVRRRSAGDCPGRRFWLCESRFPSHAQLGCPSQTACARLRRAKGALTTAASKPPPRNPVPPAVATRHSLAQVDSQPLPRPAPVTGRSNSV